MTYCFRIRFTPGASVGVASDETELVLASDRERVILRSPENDTALSQAKELVLVGKAYPSQDAAAEAADRWLGAAQKGLARLGIGADFGDRDAPGIWLEARPATPRADGTRILDNVHGVMVFECDPWPRFFGMSIEEKLGRSGDLVVQAITTAARLGIKMSGRERLAYDLYAVSFSERSIDARFTTLVMALETLIEPDPRSQQVVEYVDQMIDDVKKSNLPEQDTPSIIGTLRGLREESISQAGRRLAATLGERRYIGEEPSKFFTRCYALRSDLVHGAYPRPERSEIAGRVEALGRFVGDLLSLELVGVVPD